MNTNVMSVCTLFLSALSYAMKCYFNLFSLTVLSTQRSTCYTAANQQLDEQHKLAFYQFIPRFDSEHPQYLQQHGDRNKIHQAGKLNNPRQLSAFLTWRLQQQF